MELKDYLHFYIGTEIECTDKDCSSDMQYYGMKRTISALLLDKYLNGKWKPVLRPLTDMSNDESIELGYSRPKDWLIDHKDFGELHSAKTFVYLLKQGFDLFGLIDAGLAIDKTKQ